MSFKDRWGYKGTETALNGLTNWLQKFMDLPGNTKERYDAALKMVIAYGLENIPGYIKKGHLSTSAAHVARKIDKNKKFGHFVQWCLKQKTTHL